MSQIPYMGAKWAAKGERCSLVHWPGSLPLGLSQTAVRKTRRGIGVILQLIARCSFQTHPEQLLHGLLHFLKPFFTSLFSQLGNFWCSLFKKILHLALQEKKKIFWGSQRAMCLPWSSEADCRNLRIPCHQSLGSTLHSLCRGTPELRLLVHFNVLPSYIGIKCLRQETWLEIKRTSGRIHSNSSQTRTLHIAL